MHDAGTIFTDSASFLVKSEEINHFSMVATKNRTIKYLNAMHSQHTLSSCITYQYPILFHKHVITNFRPYLS